jgi:hypothetical protein
MTGKPQVAAGVMPKENLEKVIADVLGVKQ